MSSTVMVERAEIDRLFGALREHGYEVVGPTVRDRVIVYDRIDSVDDLPVGWTDEQTGGHYRLVRREDEALFGFVVGPQSVKKYLYPPRLTLFSVEKRNGRVSIVESTEEVPRYAFVGVRPCEVAAMQIQDRVFLEGPYRDVEYGRRREGALIVAVNCVVTGGTCFCSSMGTGPRATEGFDLSVTELLTPESHRFLIEIGTPRGEQIMADVPHRPAAEEELGAADRLLEAAGNRMGRSLDTGGLKESLQASLESPHWDEVAARCLACANCTMVCPTCFCATVEDAQSLDGTKADRTRLWDSCFTTEFSYIHGGALRTSGSARYRQWITHKLASWIDQFDTSGCVGCGRCITWCPVGIDITKEAATIRASEEEHYAHA